MEAHGYGTWAYHGDDITHSDLLELRLWSLHWLAAWDLGALRSLNNEQMSIAGGIPLISMEIERGRRRVIRRG